MHREQRHPVGENVVHLAGDALALGEPGLLDPEPLPLLGLPGPLGPGRHQLPLGADQHRHGDQADVQQDQEGDGLVVGRG